LTASAQSVLNLGGEVGVFFGPSIDAATDGPRLMGQRARVLALMADGGWRSLPGIVAELRKLYPGSKYTETSISARLRGMRALGWTIQRVRQHPTSGLYIYRATKEPSNVQ
jgi:hypothetical protein